MSQTLSNLKNSHRADKKRKRVGRGIGSGLGKTSGRGQKGAGSRSGYKRRIGYEGGQMRLHMKIPCRGFSNARFRKDIEIVNLYQLEAIFKDGEVINPETLKQNGLVSGNLPIKLLGDGTLTKKVSVELHAISASAREKLQSKEISFTEISAK